MTYRDILIPQLRVDEGVRAKLYKDTVGKSTIGVGRNLDDVGLRPDEIDYLLGNDITEAERVVRALVPGFDSLTEARQAVLGNMAFNLEHRLAGFHDFLAAVNEGRWDDAAAAMLDSAWANQVHDRAQRLSAAMRAG